jgi:hypothetical protein
MTDEKVRLSTEPNMPVIEAAAVLADAVEMLEKALVAAKEAGVQFRTKPAPNLLGITFQINSGWHDL